MHPQEQSRPLTESICRKQRHSSSRSDGSRKGGGQGKNKKNLPGSRRRARNEGVPNEKLRQREEREIKELEARIEVEMPLPGLNWMPLLSADVPKLLKPDHQGRPSYEVNPAAAVSLRLPGNAAASSPCQEALKHAENSAASILTTAAGTTPASAKSGSRSTAAAGAACVDSTEAPQERSTVTAGEERSNLAAARAAAAAAEEGGNAPTLSRYFFADLPLSSNTQRGLRDGGFVLLSQIQLRVIPHALRGADVMGEAKTGSGKTLAFLVPVLECLYRGRVSSIDGVSALILAPTRELAVQIFNVVKAISRYHEFSAGCLIGGKNVAEEAERVHMLNIVVGTPGRVLQHTEESQLWDATNLKILVIDEADRLADMGFIQTTRFIVEQLPADRQTLLFSATLRTAVKRLASFAARPDAEIMSVGGGGGLGDRAVAAVGQGSSGNDDSSCTPLSLTQSYMVVPAQFKLSALFSFLRTHSSKKSLVFVSSCKQARFVAEAFKLLKPGPKLFFLHGRQKQARRIEVFHAFIRRSPGCCLISTDLASRGIDFDQLSVGMLAASRRSSAANKGRRRDAGQHGRKGRGTGREAEQGSCASPFAEKGGGCAAAGVDFVVQLDCPDSVETYIHRVGRTARMQRSGHALLLLLPSERAFISRLKARKIEPKEAFINPQRAVKIENKLQALLASNVELKQLAQQALGCYLRGIALMPDKQVFSLPSDRQTLTFFANAYGLQLPPKITFLSTNSGVEGNTGRSDTEKTVDGEEDIRTCGGALGSSTTKKKNLSKLERLKEKIRQKRLEKEARRRGEGSGSVAGGEALPEAAAAGTTRELVSPAFKAKKTTFSEPAAAPDAAPAGDEASTSTGESDSSSGGRTGNSAAAQAQCSGKGQAGWQGEEQQSESDQQLFLVRKRHCDDGEDEDAKTTQRLLLQERMIQKPGFKRERLRFRADGSAKIKGLAAAELPRQHVFFDGEEEEEEDGAGGEATASSNSEAKQSEKIPLLADASAVEKTENEETSALVEEGRSRGCSGSRREAFLATMRTRLLLQEAADKERDRERVHERHTNKRVKERLRRQAETAGLKRHAVGSQAGSVPTVMLAGTSDVGESDSGDTPDEDEDVEEEHGRGRDSKKEISREPRRTCRRGPTDEGTVRELARNSTGEDDFRGDASQQVESMTNEPLDGSTKKRRLAGAESEGRCAVKKLRQRRQEEVQRQRLLKKRKPPHAEESTEILAAAGAREEEATNKLSAVHMAEDEAARLERVALQLLENGVTSGSGLF